MLKLQPSQTDPVQIFKGENLNPLIKDPQNSNRIPIETDTAITEAVDSILWNDEVLRSTDYHEIDVYTEDQIVHLRGHIVNATNQQRVENAVRSVPGVLDIKSTLILDDNLEREVAKALQRIEDEAKVEFFIGVQHGVVTIDGEMGDVNLLSLAEKCAASVPGVRGILNDVHIVGVDLDTEDNCFVQPSIEDQIYIRDGPSGIVKQVIINPNNRLVVAMIIQEHVSVPKSALDPTKTGQVAPFKKLVIPTREIHNLTKHGGYPQPKSGEPEQYKDFEASDFITPKKDWIPPYPYAPGDVLFPTQVVKK